MQARTMVRLLLLLCVVAPITTMGKSLDEVISRGKAGIMEHELTLVLQRVLAPYDPKTVPTFNYSTTILEVSASNVVVVGFADVEAKSFVPPIPHLSKYVTLKLWFPNTTISSTNYTINGTYQDRPITSSGTAKIQVINTAFKTNFKADSYSMDPVELCVQKDSLSFDITIEALQCTLEGADEVCADMNQNPELLATALKSRMSNTTIEDQINAALCYTNRNPTLLQ